MSVLIDLGIAAFNSGRLEESKSHDEVALEIAFETGNTRVVGIVSGNLAEYFRERGDLESAADYLTKALTALRGAGDVQTEASFGAALAFVEFRRGRIEKAEELLRESVALSQVTSDTRAIAHDLVLAAAIVVAMGRPRVATSLLGTASALQKETKLTLDAGELRLQDETLREVRIQLDASAFDEVWAAGEAMATDEAVGYMLDHLRT